MTKMSVMANEFEVCDLMELVLDCTQVSSIRARHACIEFLKCWKFSLHCLVTV